LTVLVGVLCRDGIIIGADSASTFVAGSTRTIEQPTTKIEIIGGSIILAGTGPVGMKQRFAHIVEEHWKERKFQGDATTVTTTLSALAIQNFKKTEAPRGGFGALVAFPVHKQPSLCEFDEAGFQPELKTPGMWYVSMGSGQTITDPFLGFIRRVFWTDGKPPSCQDGIFATVWAIQHAIELNPGGINGPIRVATLALNAKGEPIARMLEDGEMEEHKENVEGANRHLRKYRETPPTPIPEPPK
jgi:20S proteasome alpha/beta subunit